VGRRSLRELVPPYTVQAELKMAKPSVRYLVFDIESVADGPLVPSSAIRPRT
jgi:hypothetical protein